MNNKIKTYIAGPFFNDVERERLEKLRNYFNQEIKRELYDPFFPMDHSFPDCENMPNLEWGKKVFEYDINKIKQSELVVAVYDTQYSDSGTAWELGYAYALGIPVILLCTDLLADNSLMTISAANTVYDFEKFINDEYFDVNIINELKCLQ